MPDNFSEGGPVGMPPLSMIFKCYMVIWVAEMDFKLQYGHMRRSDNRPFFWHPEIP